MVGAYLPVAPLDIMKIPVLPVDTELHRDHVQDEIGKILSKPNVWDSRVCQCVSSFDCCFCDGGKHSIKRNAAQANLHMQKCWGVASSIYVFVNFQTMIIFKTQLFTPHLCQTAKYGILPHFKVVHTRHCTIVSKKSCYSLRHYYLAHSHQRLPRKALFDEEALFKHKSWIWCDSTRWNFPWTYACDMSSLALT